jgi:signal transduction histidine kinase
VEDEGEGIPPERLARVFEPFFTTRPEGTGLGLPVARRIVHAMGGELDVASRPGGGTRVTVVLPAASEERNARERHRHES